jgi:hypothetical protein
MNWKSWTLRAFAGAAAAEFATIWGLELASSGHQRSRKHNIFAGKASNPVPNSRLRTFWYFLYIYFLDLLQNTQLSQLLRTPPMIS